MEWLTNLHPIAQVFAIIGIAAVAGVAVYGFFQFLRGN